MDYNKRDLLIPIFKDGELVYDLPDIRERQKYCQKEFETLYPEVRRIRMPHEYYVDLTNKLRELKQELIKLHTKTKDKPKEYVK